MPFQLPAGRTNCLSFLFLLFSFVLRQTATLQQKPSPKNYTYHILRHLASSVPTMLGDFRQSDTGKSAGARPQCIRAKAACMSSAGIHMTSHSSRHNPTFGRRGCALDIEEGRAFACANFSFLSVRCVLCSTLPTVVSCAAAEQRNETTGPSRGKVPGNFNISLYPFHIQPLSRSAF